MSSAARPGSVWPFAALKPCSLLISPRNGELKPEPTAPGLERQTDGNWLIRRGSVARKIFRVSIGKIGYDAWFEGYRNRHPLPEFDPDLEPEPEAAPEPASEPVPEPEPEPQRIERVRDRYIDYQAQFNDWLDNCDPTTAPDYVPKPGERPFFQRAVAKGTGYQSVPLARNKSAHLSSPLSGRFTSGRGQAGQIGARTRSWSILRCTPVRMELQAGDASHLFLGLGTPGKTREQNFICRWLGAEEGSSTLRNRNTVAAMAALRNGGGLLGGRAPSWERRVCVPAWFATTEGLCIIRCRKSALGAEHGGIDRGGAVGNEGYYGTLFRRRGRTGDGARAQATLFCTGAANRSKSMNFLPLGAGMQGFFTLLGHGG
ncbi:hypothetical protein C8R47DRAFT_1076225 [Mycena vitilis]|nr:hypothetical protein C8R47DRAFT_1076225 [Mycena vitilis]